jgi:hypothetical protein
MKMLSGATGFVAYICVALVFCVARPSDTARPTAAAHGPLPELLLPTESKDASLSLAVLPDKGLSITEPPKPITFSMHSEKSEQSVLFFAKPCTGAPDNDVSFMVNDGNGEPIVTINECTGKVTVSHPERMDEQARQFWRTVQKAFPDVCAERAKGSK